MDRNEEASNAPVDEVSAEETAVENPQEEVSVAEDEPVIEVRKPNPMRTVLYQFSEAFTEGVEPMMEPLTRVQQVIEQASADNAVRATLPGLRDTSHHLRALLEKVQEQHAYVLIFGPLKSGKSTLMNSICSSYVSEVTALPAYPCLVHMSHGEDARFKVTRYDGTEEVFADQASLYEAVERGHGELTNRLREVEEAGDSFEPSTHMPSALRKIDVHLPAEDLATSGAVLVDTPGLYSRMKFGYDRMTRDFRDAAACAIFVVKSDNLFLEQVFEEFTDLLDLFSRIFLIVNLDSRKCDLNAQGELIPSLESADPDKIIDAFRDLAMSAPLKKAVDDGRLQIYPVDLLNAASNRIRSAAGEGSLDAAGGDFERLNGDLSEYLNSSAYLKEFLADSLRRADSLLSDAGEQLSHASLSELERRLDVLRIERSKLQKEKGISDRLQEKDWAQQAKALRTGITSGMEKKVAEITTAAENHLRTSVEQWWEKDDSLGDLLKRAVLPCKEGASEEFVEHFRSLIELEMARHPAGVDAGGALGVELSTIGVDMEKIGAAAYAETHLVGELETNNPKVNVDEIPVRRGFWDWILFRSAAKMRKIVFGEPDAFGKSISVATKAKRLGEEGREILLKQTMADFATLWSSSVKALPEEYVTAYLKLLTEKLQEVLTKVSGSYASQLQELETRIARGEVIVKEADAARTALTQASYAVHALGKTYGSIEDAVVVEEEEYAAEEDEDAPEWAEQEAERSLSSDEIENMEDASEELDTEDQH